MTGLVLLLLAPIVVTALVTATAGPTAAATNRAQATLEVAALDPLVGVPDRQLHATGSVRNTGTLRLVDVFVDIRLSRTPLSSRAELAVVAAGRTDSRRGPIVASQRLPGRLEPGQQTGFDLGVALKDVPFLRAFGVHVLTIEVRAASSLGVGRVGVLRSFLPWAPDPREFKATGFSWLWPVASRPRRLAQGTSFVDDSLTQEMAAGGRLERLVTAGQRISTKVPVGWVVDPTVLDDASAMAAPDGAYSYADPSSGRQVKGSGGITAGEWLTQVRAATLDRPVVTLPYGDPDLVALRRSGLEQDLTRAHIEGGAVTADVLGGTPTTDVAWPADGRTDAATLAALRKEGFAAVVLSADATPPTVPTSATPTGRADLPTPSGTATALLYDPTLGRLLSPPGSASPILAAQRFLAETAMVTAEAPSAGTTRRMLIAPARHWSPGAEFLDRVVAATLAAPWIGGVDLDALRATAPPEIDRTALRYPRSVRAVELSPNYLASLKVMDSDIALFATVLSEPQLLIPALDHAVLRLESTWWRRREGQRVRSWTLERAHLTAQREKITISPGSYTFGSRSGTIPVTIANELDQAVNVSVRLAPLIAKLSVDNSSVEATPIGANRKVQVPVPASARASGRLTVTTQLLTPDGVPYDDRAVALDVNITQFGTAALFVTMGAAAVLLLGGGARVARRVVLSGRGETSGRGEPGEPGEPGASAP